jgi:hypothetical protein
VSRRDFGDAKRVGAAALTQMKQDRAFRLTHGAGNGKASLKKP